MPNPIRSVSLLKQALKKDHMRYIDGVLKTYRRKGWSKMTKEEQGEYQALVELFNENKELFTYEDQLFYALGKYPEIDKAFKGSSLLDEALVTKAFSKKIDTTLDDYIKRIEDMIKEAETGKYNKYTADDIYTILEEMAEEGLPELLKDRQSLNMLANPLDINTIDEAGKLDVLVDAVNKIRQSDDALLPSGSAISTQDPILYNLRQSRQHINNLDDAQINKPKMDWRDNIDLFNGDDAPGFADPSINDYSINSDMTFNATYKNVAKEAEFKPIQPENLKGLYQGSDEASDFTFVLEEVEGVPVRDLPAGFSTEELTKLQRQKIALEGRKAQAESYMKSGEWQLEQEGMAMMEEAQAALNEIEAEMARLSSLPKKQGGGFIDSPLYLRDY